MKDEIINISPKVFVIVLLIVFYGCIKSEKSSTSNNQSILNKMNATECQLLARERIFFGHRSVGSNIIEGIEEITKETCPDLINVTETRNLDSIHSPFFAHARIGENGNPKSKIDDFIGLIHSGVSDSLDIAVLKFCFVDITRNTDIQDLFSYYKTAFEKIQKEYPHTKFIHMTVPLITKGTGIKGWIKMLIGHDSNINRTRYNELLRKNYDNDRLFDIARIESTYPDSKRETGPKNSEALVPVYTNDGGHLNQEGRRLVAEQFLLFLAHGAK